MSAICPLQTGPLIKVLIIKYISSSKNLYLLLAGICLNTSRAFGAKLISYDGIYGSSSQRGFIKMSL
ncbi:hypothetical protein AF79_07675 [Aliarcobacter butzleri L354]|nr:hypothetical protein AF79_07675 [Aliarcobacter butzleri L354]